MTFNQLNEILKGKNTHLWLSADELTELYNSLINCFDKYQINTGLRKSHFLAQILHESGYFKYKHENLNYSAKALLTYFKKYFPTLEIAKKYERKPEQIANKVYGGRMGNTFKGDGWKYKGRGYIQLTGRDNYTLATKDFNKDFVSNPDLIAQYPYCILLAGWYWDKKHLNYYADFDNITKITYRINGGYNGLQDRLNNLKIVKQILL